MGYGQRYADAFGDCAEAGESLAIAEKIENFLFSGHNIVDEFRLFCYNSSLRGYGRESLAAQIHGGARQWKNIANPKRLWASSR